MKEPEEDDCHSEECQRHDVRISLGAVRFLGE